MTTISDIRPLSEGSGPISVPAAIIFGLLTSFIQSFGLTIQRKSHIQNARLPTDLQRSEWKRPMWVIGFVVFLVANIGGTVFQIGALPIVMLAPLGAVSLLYNALLARFILDDFFSIYMILGTALIAIGAVLIGYFGVVQEPTHSLDDLLSLFVRPTFVAFATLFTLAFLGVLGVAHLAEWQLHVRLFRPKDTEANKRKRTNSPKNKKKKQPMTRRWSAPSLAPVAEVSESSSGIATPVLAIADEAARRGIPVERVLMQKSTTVPNTAMTTGRIPMNASKNAIQNYGSIRARGSPISSSASSFSSFEENENRSTSAAALLAAEHDPAIRKICLGLAVAYGGASGTLSGACLLLAKSGVELLVLTIAGDNQFNRWQSWFLVIIMLIAALLQLWYLNKSLRLASPPLVCPLAFCFYNTSSIALGMVYFDQLGSLSVVSITLVTLGVVILLSGVWMVSLHGSENEEEKRERINDEERQPLLLGDEQETIVSSPQSSIISPTTTIPKSSTTETEAILANFLGVAGPHLPPASPENGAISSDVLLQSGDDEYQGDVGKKTRKMRSRSGSGSGHIAGLGFHIPGLPTLQREAEENGRDRQQEQVDEPSSSIPSSETASNQNGSNGEQIVDNGKGVKLPRLRTSIGGRGSMNEAKQSSTTLLSPPSKKRRGLYESLMERGLSIGISPSSPGFHIGSSFELEPEENEDEDAMEARRLWKSRFLSRRTFSENDTSLASARRRSKMATITTEEIEEARESGNGQEAGVEDNDDRESINSSSAWTKIVPTLDIQMLNDRLRKLKVGAGDWIGKKKP